MYVRMYVCMYIYLYIYIYIYIHIERERESQKAQPSQQWFEHVFDSPSHRRVRQKGFQEDFIFNMLKYIYFNIYVKVQEHFYV